MSLGRLARKMRPLCVDLSISPSKCGAIDADIEQLRPLKHPKLDLDYGEPALFVTHALVSKPGGIVRFRYTLIMPFEAVLD